MSSFLILVTGAPGCGQTAMIDELVPLFIPTIPERVVVSKNEEDLERHLGLEPCLIIAGGLVRSVSQYATMRALAQRNNCNYVLANMHESQAIIAGRLAKLRLTGKSGYIRANEYLHKTTTMLRVVEKVEPGRFYDIPERKPDNLAEVFYGRLHPRVVRHFSRICLDDTATLVARA